MKTIIIYVLLAWSFFQFGYLGDPLAPCAHAQVTSPPTPQPNPNCPHHKAVMMGSAQTMTNCAPPPECICQQACAVICKP